MKIYKSFNTHITVKFSDGIQDALLIITSKLSSSNNLREIQSKNRLSPST